MENKSYPEILHRICVEYGHGEKDRIASFEKAIVLLIDQIITDEKKKLLPNDNRQKGEHYLKNDNIKSDCDSCSRHDIIVGCTLKHKNKCAVDGKYTKYRRGHLLPCDRCKTYSVVTKIDRVPDNNKNNIPRPAIRFICLKCKDYPIINKGVFKGYELKGMEFTERYLYTYAKREREEQKAELIQQADPTKVVQPIEPIKIVQPEETTNVVQSTETINVVQQEGTEIEIVPILTEIEIVPILTE